MHRATLLNVLRDNLPTRCAIHYNKRLISYTQSDGPAKLFFADGTSAEADVVVGADGINSATRRTMFLKSSTEQRFSRPSWTGTYCYRTLVDAAKVLKALPGHQATSIPIIVSYVLSANNAYPRLVVTLSKLKVYGQRQAHRRLSYQ